MEDAKKGCKNPECQQITKAYCEKCKLNFTAKSIVSSDSTQSSSALTLYYCCVTQKY